MLATETQIKTKRQRGPSPTYCRDLDQLIGSGAATLGMRGTIASVISAIERGGGPGSSDVEAHLTDALLGYGPQWNGRGQIAQVRKLLARWEQLSTRDQHVLLVHYARRPPSEQVGGNASAWPRHAELLGDCCAVALWLAWQRGKLAAVLQALDRQKGDALAGPAKAAQKLVEESHRCWRAIGELEALRWAE